MRTRRVVSWTGWVLLAVAALAVVFAKGAAAAGPASPALPEGWHHAAFAEIYVRGYRDSDGDGIGDLRGLAASLDYLQALGVRGLWLMPVTRSQDHDHGYAVADYRDIEPDYGTLADFDTLLREAHARGIGVIVDYVLNHSAAEHPAFVASRDPADPHRGWYRWEKADPGGWSIFGKSPWNATPTGAYLSQFSPTMPDFDLRNPDVIRFHADNLRFWLDRGVDGFRFDAVTHLVENGPDAWNDQPESYPIVAAMRAVVDEYPNRYVVCEAASSEEVYARADVCGHGFAIRRARDFLAAARGDRNAIRKVAGFPHDSPTLATLLSNHDAFAGRRVRDQLGADDAAYRLAAATYLLQPATPFIFYGEEIGLAGAATLDGDRQLRVPMSWTGDARNAGFTTGTPFRALAANVATSNVAAGQVDAHSLLAHYRALLALRNTRPSLARGTYEHEFVRGKAYGFQRVHEGERTLVLVNYGARAVAVQPEGLSANARLRELLPGNETVDTGHVKLAPRSVRVFAVAN
ncbi:MAG: alpha-amylase family glycosyl hydrolase [Arenimonas sp.]